MSIFTRYQLRQNKIPSAGRISQQNSVGPAWAVFYPCDEGAGTTLTDIINGSNLPTATNSWDGPYHQGSDSNEAVAAAFPNVAADESFILFAVIRQNGSPAAITAMGSSGNPRLGLGTGSAFPGGVLPILTNTALEAATFPSFEPIDVQNGDEIGFAIVCDREADTITAWALNGAVVESKIAAEKATDFGAVQPSQVLTQQNDCAGIALYKSAGGVPYDWQAVLTQLTADWTAGRKTLPADWVSLA